MIILLIISIVGCIINPIVGIAMFLLILLMACFVYAPIIAIIITLFLIWLLFGIDIERKIFGMHPKVKKKEDNNLDKEDKK